jgi:phosphatidylserine/phosphatidylglycerophosphate/cardiolipin synthase-like enzyme
MLVLYYTLRATDCPVGLGEGYMKRASLALVLFIASAANPHIYSAKAEPQTPVTSSGILISALHYNGYESYDDEAVQLTNVSASAITLDSSWSLVDQDNRAVIFPTITFPSNSKIWIANTGAAFKRQFGFSPTLTYSDTTGTPLKFTDTGGSVRLQKSSPPQTIDTANNDGGGWNGGSGSPNYFSMERIDSRAIDAPTNWASANIASPFAFDANGNPIRGTPRAANSVAITSNAITSLAVIINEVAWGGTQASSTHEWVELKNNLDATAVLTGWELRIVGKSGIPLTGTIAPNAYFVIQRNAATFSSGATGDLTSTSLQLSNSGETLQLVNTQLEVVDTLVYGKGTAQTGWIAPPLQPYTVTNLIGDDGQLLMRRLNSANGLPVADTDTAADWFNHRGDPLESRQPIFPGWDIETFFAPVHGSGTVTVVVAPDASFDAVSQTLASATTSIDLESFTFENVRLGELLAAKAASGVRVRVLLDGAPVEGLPDQTRFICKLITQARPADSGCWFMFSNTTTAIPMSERVYRRYRYLHAKFAVIDNALLLIGSENFGLRGMPDDDQSNGTSGQRGVITVINSPQLVARANAIFAADIDSNHRDITRWCETCSPFGLPPTNFVPITISGGTGYTPKYSPLRINDVVSMSLSSSPENHLHSSDGIIELLNRVSAGDEVLVEQLDEPAYWGASSSNPIDDPNPRISAMVGAASRGAKVRVVLDGYYDSPTDSRSNITTTTYFNQLAQLNGWDLRAVRANPTGQGIHNKMILVRIGSRYFAHIGSWNGTEMSAKRNREMSVLIESKIAFDYLRGVFFGDFQFGLPIHLPIVMNRYKQVNYPLITEVMVNPSGADETGREWIEIHNPTQAPISLRGYKIGDAILRTTNSSEGVFRFPDNASIPALGVIVIAQEATKFQSEYGLKPNYELINSDESVPDLQTYTNWSSGVLTLANLGDEVALFSDDDIIVDVVVWLNGYAEGVLPFAGTILAGHSLSRTPSYQDSDDCATDFRILSIPTPGTIP